MGRNFFFFILSIFLQCRPRNITIDTFWGLQVNLNPYQGLKIPLNGSNSWKTSNFCKFQKKFCVVDSMAEQKFLPWITYIEVWKNRFWRNFGCNFFFELIWLQHAVGLDLSSPNRKRLEVSKNVKHITVTSRASKLQVSKVGELRDLNPGLPRESIALC